MASAFSFQKYFEYIIANFSFTENCSSSFFGKIYPSIFFDNKDLFSTFFGVKESG
jgi:hypothetical protein